MCCDIDGCEYLGAKIPGSAGGHISGAWLRQCGEELCQRYEKCQWRIPVGWEYPKQKWRINSKLKLRMGSATVDQIGDSLLQNVVRASSGERNMQVPLVVVKGGEMRWKQSRIVTKKQACGYYCTYIPMMG
jgi:hypothetical protein